MSEQVYTTQPIAILGIPKNPEHVAENIIIINTVLDKLGSSGDNLVDPAVLATQITHAETLLTKQEAMSGGADDRTEQRNIAYAVCFKDHKDDLDLVNTAARNKSDFNEAAALIKRNGYEIKKEYTTPANPDISIRHKEGSKTTIIAEVKAPDTTKNYSIDWEYSYDNGETWTHLNATAVCDREIKNLERFKEVIVRARFTIGYDDPADWIISNGLDM